MRAHRATVKGRLKWLWVVAACLTVAATTHVDFQAADAARTRSTLQTETATPAPPREYDLCPGEGVALPMSVYLPPAPVQADIIFAFDTTSSMLGVIADAQQTALDVTANLQNLIADIRFGVVDFRDYPYSPYGDDGDWPYLLRQPLTYDANQFYNAVEALEADGGMDTAEAYTRALYEIYQDTTIGWRPEARRLVVMFGDSVAHDDDLNAGVPTPQPHLPGEVWRPGDEYPSPYLDPGRDGVPGTSDDLDFQETLHQLREQSFTLLFLLGTVPFHLEGVGTDDLLVYWRVWSGMTGPGGDARALGDVDDLPATIEDLVAAAGHHIDHLGISVAPTWFEEWVTIDPPSYVDFDIPADGLNRDFEVQIAVPAQVPAGRYTIVLIAEADGIAHNRQQVIVNVPATCFAPPTPTVTPTAIPTPTPTLTPVPTVTPRPIWHTYVPLLANNRANWRP